MTYKFKLFLVIQKTTHKYKISQIISFSNFIYRVRYMIRFFYDLFILACKPCLRMEILNNNNKFAEFCQYCAYYIYFWKYVFNNNNNNLTTKLVEHNF